MTSELERIKILEGKISQVVDYINKLKKENEKLRQQLKELKIERKSFEEKARRADKIDESLKQYENERKIIKGKVETIINQIDQLGI
ncbi:MAG: cell division protein ZapB [Candidatus Aminicenantes bacterium]|nr:cell division protein ZapB [Candidatus Aminicenantes bacterium]MCK4495603.1 cell division protein ZapB [Candidatus Aminicenantes bacterium]TET74274.1 MAG: cell division protein ZapB [Candidatus Aminicenantes bacterium]